MAGHDYWFVIDESVADSESRVPVAELLATLEASPAAGSEAPS
jgi:hypothetical protein